MQNKNPKWWTSEHDTGWEHTKTALARDWEQTKHDFGSKTAPNLHQSAGDTVKQATASTPASHDFAAHEPAFRYGYGAQQHYGGQAWDDKLESTLKGEYNGDWQKDRDSVRHAYTFKTPTDKKS